MIFIPPLRVRFESIGNKFANGITKGPVGLPPGVGSASDKRISNDAGLSKTARKNLRRKDRKRDAADSASTATEPDDSPATFSYDASMHRVSECSTRKSGRLGGESSTLGVEEKRVKALRKKLRQIDKLSADIDDGVIANADPDQVAKVNSRSKVELELQSLVDNMRIE